MPSGRHSRTRGSRVSRLCEEIPRSRCAGRRTGSGRVKAFLDRPIEGDCPYVGLDAPRTTTTRTRASGALRRLLPASPSEIGSSVCCRSMVADQLRATLPKLGDQRQLHHAQGHDLHRGPPASELGRGAIRHHALKSPWLSPSYSTCAPPLSRFRTRRRLARGWRASINHGLKLLLDHWSMFL
jgi:hypothetical protein